MYKVTSKGLRYPTSALYESACEALCAFHELQCSGATEIEIADCEDTPLTEKQLVVVAMMDVAAGSRRPTTSRT